MARILCIGDLMLDVVVMVQAEFPTGINYGSDTPAQISTHGGGAAANTATWLAATGHEVFFASRTGDDAAAEAVIAELDSWKISHKELRNPGQKTGVVVVLVDETGQRTMFPDSGANSGLNPSDLPELNGFDAVFLSGYSLYNKASTSGVQEIIKKVKESGTTLIFDPASVGTMLDFGNELAISFLNKMDVLLLNEEESMFITGASDVQTAIVDLGKICSTVVVKRGAAGALGIDNRGVVVEVSTKPITALDTTGAGDAFAAGFIPSWIATRDLNKSILAGNEIAANCVAIIGARPSVNPQ